MYSRLVDVGDAEVDLSHLEGDIWRKGLRQARSCRSFARVGASVEITWNMSTQGPYARIDVVEFKTR